MDRILFGVLFFALAMVILKIVTHGKSEEALADLRHPQSQAKRMISVIGFIVIAAIAIGFWVSVLG